MGIISALLVALMLITVFTPVSTAAGEGQSVLIYPETVYAVPGGSAVFSLLFYNNDSEEASFSLTTRSLDPRISWDLIVDNQSAKDVTIPPASSINTLLSFSVPSTMPAGLYPFSLKGSGDMDSYINGTVAVEIPKLSLSRPVVRNDGDYFTFSLNVTASGNVSASNVVLSLYIDGKMMESIELNRVSPASATPVVMRGSLGPGSHNYEIKAATMDGYSAVTVSGTESVKQTPISYSWVPYLLISFIIFLLALSQAVRAKRRRARLTANLSKTSMMPEELLRMDSTEEEK